MVLEGIIQKDGTVLTEKGEIYRLPRRGTDEKGYPEVLIDAKPVGGRGVFSRQSIKPYIGMKVSFYCNTKAPHGFNYTIIKEENED